MDWSAMFDRLSATLGETLPMLAGALGILIVGWFAAVILRAILRGVLTRVGINERVALSGDSFFTLNPVIGGSYLMRDNLSMEFGAFYEFPLDSSDDSVVLNVPVPGVGIVPSQLDAEVYPDGFIGFVGLSYYF